MSALRERYNYLERRDKAVRLFPICGGAAYLSIDLGRGGRKRGRGHGHESRTAHSENNNRVLPSKTHVQ